MNALFSKIDNLVAKIHTEHIKDEPGIFEAHGTIDIGGLNIEELIALVEAFGIALYIKLIQKSGSDMVISLNTTESQIVEYIDESKDCGESSFNVVISLAKVNLLDHILEEKPNSIQPIVFIYYDKFFDWVTKVSFEELEKTFSPDCLNVIFIMEKEIMLSNDHLLVIGGNLDGAINSINNCVNPDSTYQLGKETIVLRNNNCSWLHGTNYLTPQYFYFKPDQLATFEGLGKAFSLKILNLVVPFLASSTTTEESGYCIATILGYKAVKLNLGTCCNVDQEQVLKAYELFNWIYRESNTTDKLGIFRNIVSLYLTKDTDLNIDSFLEHINDISYSTRSSFDVYLKENVKLYFEQRKKIEDFIQGKIKEITDQISAVVGLMSKNLITTIGAILAAILTQVNKPSSNLANIAILSYMVFVALSTAYYSSFTMISVCQSIASYDHNIKYARKTLNDDDVTDLAGNFVRNKKIVFYCFWGVTLFISLALIGIGVFLLAYPGVLLQLQTPIK